MSLLAALAKGFGAGTVNNAQVGFAEQQRQREAAQRRDDMNVELDARDKLAQKQIDASRAENDTRFKAMADENQKNRDHDWAMFERRLAAETQAAAANASVRAREMHAKNIMGTMDQLSKRKTEILGDDKLTDEQRAVALGEIDALGYTLAADPGAQQLLGSSAVADMPITGYLLLPKKRVGLRLRIRRHRLHLRQPLSRQSLKASSLACRVTDLLRRR